MSGAEEPSVAGWQIAAGGRLLVHINVQGRDSLRTWFPKGRELQARFATPAGVSFFRKKQQQGNDLGDKMQHAFIDVFNMGYQRAIIIGSDMYDLNTQELEDAFLKLEDNNFVIGPGQDGGYYLLGMKHLKPQLFKNKKWGTHRVLSDTLQDLELENLAILAEKNDVDYYEDIKDIAVFKKFFPHMKD